MEFAVRLSIDAGARKKEILMVLIAFRSRMRPDVDEAEIERVGARMYEVATAMPGFISYRDYLSDDNEFLTLVQFESHETLAAWRNHPEHVAVQIAARERYFSEYQISVCDVVRDYAWPPQT